MRIFGTLCEAGSESPIGNLIVRAYNRDLLFDEPIGFATSNADGSFEIRTKSRKTTRPTRHSGLFLRVLDATGEHEIYHTLDSLRKSAGDVEEFVLSIPPENLSSRFERRDIRADTPQEFVEALSALTPRIFITPMLVFLNVAVYAWLVFEGASPLAPEVGALVEWGANVGELTLGGEWWRLVTCLFLHGGILHLTLNCWVLIVVGRVVERLVGSTSFAALYLASGVLASLTSLAWNPFVASVGASGAIFGLWGALLGYALRKHDPVTLRGLLRLRNAALVFLVANVIFDMTQEQIDLAAHLGGLVAGFGGGLILSQPVSLAARASRGPRLALLCATSVILVLGFAAAIPRRAVEIGTEFATELERFTQAQVGFTRKFEQAFSGEEGSLEISEMHALLVDELLPEWIEARGRLEQLLELSDLPSPRKAQIEEAARQSREQEARWRALAGDFSHFQDAFTELQELEDKALGSFERAVAEIRAGALSHDDFADVLDREVLAQWERERKLDGLDDLREPLQTLAGSLRLYANTREKAWSLYAEALRSGSEELARAAAEEHHRADAMIASWAGMQLDPPAPPASEPATEEDQVPFRDR